MSNRAKCFFAIIGIILVGAYVYVHYAMEKIP